MSLSQKHAGKVLVPWFNTSEWIHVYRLIYDSDDQNWPQALAFLHIWKTRTPLLSAGVEGSLILIESLLCPTVNESERQHIFSTSLIRFLNLCATNSDKQGTFHKCALKNELPKWLIGLRHDIAHSHILPSGQMLELTLNYCLGWVKTRYWDSQGSLMSDFVAVTSSSRFMVERSVDLYVAIIVGARVVDDELSHLYGVSLSDGVDSVLSVLEEFFKSLDDGLKSFTSDCFKSELLTRSLIFSHGSSDWTQLLDLLDNCGLVERFVEDLIDLVGDDSRSSKDRQSASILIRNICQNHVRGNINKRLVNKVMERPCHLTLNFLQEFLTRFEAPPEFIDDCQQLIGASTVVAMETLPLATNGIYTVSDLNLEEVQNVPISEVKVSRWEKIEDVDIYKNLPLGILPHQSRTTNPVLLA